MENFTGGGEQDPDGIGYVKEAFKWQYNLIALAGAAAFAVAARSELPLLLASGLELMYLSIVPQMARFRRLIRSRKYAEEQRQQDLRLHAMYYEIPPEMRGRFDGVRALCRTIAQNYERLSSTSRIFCQQMEDRLGGLRRGYLRLLHASFQHREHLRTISPDVIHRELDELERTLANNPPKVQEINRKRIEIMTKRLEKYEKIRENCSVIDAQCAAIEDVLKLIRDQSVTLRDPQQVTEQLDALVQEVEQTEETVRQVEAIYELAAPELAPTLSPLPSGDSSTGAGGRNRIRT